MDRDAIVEAGKEAVRLAIFAAAGAVVNYFLGYFANLPETTTTVIITFVLRAVDKYIHADPTTRNGLLPF